MKKICALTDYKGHFGSKWKAHPYRSGFDKSLLANYVHKYGYTLEFLKFKDVDLSDKNWKHQIVVYTSSEEIGYNYKSFIEDTILGLTQLGAHVLPRFPFLRANNNKVFMEILGSQLFDPETENIPCKVYGIYEELMEDLRHNRIQFPCVVKTAIGAMGRGVFLARNASELSKYTKKISRSRHLKYEIKDRIRQKIHKGYKPESKYQHKFILQPFIPNLTNDWKILIFGDHYFVLKRGIKKGDFRASGSGTGYQTGRDAEFPVHMLDAIETIYNKCNVPHLSIDYGFDGKRGYLLEYQAVYFGTATHHWNQEYFIKKDGEWITKQKEFDQEEEYIWGLVHYLKNHPDLG